MGSISRSCAVSKTDTSHCEQPDMKHGMPMKAKGMV